MRKIILFAFIFYLLSFIFGGSRPVQAACSPANIAGSKAVTVSSYRSGYPGSNLTNCNWGDLWIASSTSLPQTVEINLGSVQEVGSIKTQISQLVTTGTVRFEVWLGNASKQYGSQAKNIYNKSTVNGAIIEIPLGSSTGPYTAQWVKLNVTNLPTGSTASFTEIEIYNAVNCRNLTGPDYAAQNANAVFTAEFLSPNAVLSTEISAGKDGGMYSRDLWTPTPPVYNGSYTSPGSWYSKSYTFKASTPFGAQDIFCRTFYGNASNPVSECRGNALYFSDLPQFTCGGPTAKKTLNVCAPNVLVSGSVTGAPGSVTISINGQQFSGITGNFGKTVLWASSYTVVPVTDFPGYITPSAITKSGLGCDNNPSGFSFTYSPIVIADAGVVTMTSPTGSIDSGTGQISQSGNPPGFRLENYTNFSSSALNSQVSYNNLLNAVIKNSGVGSTTNLNNQITCQSGGIYTTPDNKYDFYCYNGTTGFSNHLTAAFGDSDGGSKTYILYPISLSPNVAFTPPFSLNGRKIIVFIDNGSLTVNGNLQVQANAGIVFVLKTGGVSVASSVGRLDGVYIFPGAFDDGASATQLIGSGSLINTGTTGTSLGFSRSYSAGNAPAELWTYQPKYLELFRQSLAVPRYTWKELPPQ